MTLVKPTTEYYTLVTASTNVINAFDDYIIQASTAPINVTLPSASSTGLQGKIFRFRRIDFANQPVNIVANGTDTIEGRSHIALDPFRVIKLIRNSTADGWTRLMENERLLSVYTYTASSDLVDGYDIHFVNNTSSTALTLPISTSVPVGTRYYIYTNAPASVVVTATSPDLINGAASFATPSTGYASLLVVNVGPGNWVTFT